MSKSRSLTCIILLALVAAAAAQGSSNGANWTLQEKYSGSALRKFVYSTSVRPSWINESDKFWYVWNESTGRRFMFVDPSKKSKRPAFDHDKLAGALSELGKKPVVGNQLPFSSIKYDEDETAITFTVDDQKYEWNLKDETLKKVEKDEDEDETPPRGPGQGFRGQRGQGGNRNRPTFSVAPDKLTFVYMQGYNLYFGKKEDEEDKEDDVEATQLTEDGEQFYEFRSVNYRTYTLGDKQERKTRVGANWSEDSEAFSIVRSDAREVKDLFVINSLSTPRPTLEVYKYQMPGEENVQLSTLYVYIDGSLSEVDVHKWTDQTISNIHWTGEGHEKLRFVRRDRLQRNLELCEYDMETAEIKVLITESVEDAALERGSARYVGENNTGDILWWSERNGWGHFYLYSHDGEFKNVITSGTWRAETMMGVDEEAERMWFSAVGKESGENIYNTHQYSIGLDGSGLRMLTHGDANHSLSLSESRKYGVDSFSRVDMAPTSVVRDDRGRTVLELETMDLSKLEEMGWHMPERFVVKAQDGVTDIYGNLWKPFDFDPNMKYPVILHIYPGPQTESVSNSFSATASDQELAQLGFIVIQIGNRGGTPRRSNAYHSYGYYNLRDYGLADKKTGVEQLAGRYDWIDIDRVGIFGHSGGGFMTAAAMLLPPFNEFFKVGVSSSGNHDNNIYNANWSERNHGLKVVVKKEEEEEVEEGGGRRRGGRGRRGGGQQQQQQQEEEEEQEQDEDEDEGDKFEIRVPTTVELAENLEGKLLLVTGEIDNNVHPGGTIRLVDALIKANKRFDFMIMPGKRHGYGSMSGYFRQMLYEYFSRHLMGDTYDASAEMDDKKND